MQTSVYVNTNSLSWLRKIQNLVQNVDKNKIIIFQTLIENNNKHSKVTAVPLVTHIGHSSTLQSVLTERTD